MAHARLTLALACATAWTSAQGGAITATTPKRGGNAVAIAEGTSADMESYAERIPTPDIWNLVNYLRSLKPRPYPSRYATCKEVPGPCAPQVTALAVA